MAIEFTNKPTKWENEGAEPSTELKKNGFQAGYKPPAEIFNHHWHESAECIEELQTKLSDVDDKKVDKVEDKSLIDENVSKQIVYNPNDNYVHVDFKYTKGSGIDCSGVKIQRLSREDEVSDYEASETLPYTELSGAGINLRTPDNEASVELSTSGFAIDSKKEQPSPSILLGTKTGDIIVRNYTTKELHYLSKKANSSDVLTKTNTTEFTPTADYHPATKKYVDDKVDSITVPIIDNLESDSTTSALSAKQGKVLDAAIAAKVDKKGTVALINEYLTYGLPDDVTWNYSLYLSYVLAVLNGKTSPQSTFAIPIGNGDLELGFAVKKGHLILKEGSVCVDNGDVAAYTNGKVHKLSNKIDKVDGKGLSTNDFTNTYKTKLDNLDTNLSAKAAKTDVLTKTNTAAFTPTANYHPATKKYVDDTVANLPIKSLESKTLSTFYNETAIAQTGATIIGDCSERTFSTVGTEHFVETGNIATGLYAVAAGTKATATGDYSTVFGRSNAASGHASFAAGQDTKASGYYSTIFGRDSTALDYQFKIGSYAKDGTAGAMNSTVGDAFIIGNGVDKYGSTGLVRSNAFRVTYEGKVYGLASYSSSGADYAEYFEWKDGNPDNEDRRGRLVTLDGEKIRFATADDDYILGVVSANPCIEGDVYSDDWQGKYLTDVFGQRLTQTVHIPARYEEQEITDPETGETTTENVLIEDEHDAVQWVLNPDYDPEQEYISREDRKEWTSIGLMGKLVVIDDGTCEVNGYCKAGVNGIATKADDGYRVMARIDDTHIRVLVR